MLLPLLEHLTKRTCCSSVLDGVIIRVCLKLEHGSVVDGETASVSNAKCQFLHLLMQLWQTKSINVTCREILG